MTMSLSLCIRTTILTDRHPGDGSVTTERTLLWSLEQIVGAYANATRSAPFLGTTAVTVLERCDNVSLGLPPHTPSGLAGLAERHGAALFQGHTRRQDLVRGAIGAGRDTTLQRAITFCPSA